MASQDACIAELGENFGEFHGDHWVPCAGGAHHGDVVPVWWRGGCGRLRVRSGPSWAGQCPPPVAAHKSLTANGGCPCPPSGCV